MTDQPSASDPDAIQHRIQRIRAGVLGGRGPGASRDELTRWQRDRPLLGARPAPAERQQVADETILARSDPGELEHLIVRHRASLSATRAAFAGQLQSQRARAGAALRLAGLTALAGAAAGAVVTVAAGTVLRRRRSARP